jgi:dipeptidyl aminopeptidase/acylaminoacyl peptidase
MPDVDFDRRLGALDSIDAPDLWGRATSMTPRDAAQVLRRSSIGRVLIVVFSLLVALAGIGFAVNAFRRAPALVDQPPPLGPGSIAYVEFNGAPLNQWSLYTMKADGSSAKRIPLDLAGEANHPSWSPDGSKLAFDVQEGGDTEIYVVDADGSNLSKLTSTDGWNFLPAWSPDSLRIAYVHASKSNHDIWLMNADGSNPVRLTRDPDFDLNPTWSPDASKLAFESNRTGSPEIYVMNADGSNVSMLTDAPGFDGSPEWSPDGHRIAFVSERDGPGIYLMESDGTGVHKLVEGKQVGPMEPEWSPDGALLAYTSSPGADMAVGIFVLDLASGRTQALTEPGDVCCPSWVLPQEPDTGPAVPGTCDYGPWIKYCPEAEWARSVAAAAGIDVIDEEGVLIIGPRDGGEFLFWAMDPAIHSQGKPLSESLPDTTLVAFGDVDGVPVYVTEDGDKVAWSSHGLNVWVAEHIIGLHPPRRLIVALVRAAESMPYTSGLPPSAYRQCRPPEVRPSYLPWIEQGDPIPRPIVSYDEEIDRAQLSWPDPNYPQGRAGIGLTVYTHTPLGSLGEETDVDIDGVAGRLHREDEGGLVGISWTLRGSECNYMELVLADPDSSKLGAIDELLKVARSLA